MQAIIYPLRLACVLLFFLVAGRSLSVAQAVMQFDSSVYDFGVVYNTIYFEREMRFKNTGKEPLIIQSIWGSDGGMVFSIERDRVFMPGKSGIMKVRYDVRQRIHQFKRTAYIVTNGGKTEVTVKGEVIYAPTTIETGPLHIDVGNLSFGETTTAHLEMTNTGNNELHLSASDEVRKDAGVFTFYLRTKNKIDYDWMDVDTGETVKVVVGLRNCYGNTEPFRKEIGFGYNSRYQLKMVITGRYSGKPDRDTIVEGPFMDHYHEYYYKKGKLVRVRKAYHDKTSSETYYEGSSPVPVKRFGEGQPAKKPGTSGKKGG